MQASDKLRYYLKRLQLVPKPYDYMPSLLEDTSAEDINESSYGFVVDLAKQVLAANKEHVTSEFYKTYLLPIKHEYICLVSDI
jgi:hypothetical protein